MWNKQDALTELFNEAVRRVGLGRFKFEIHRRADLPCDYYATASVQLPDVALAAASDTPMTAFIKVCKPILEDVENSETVRDALADLNKRAEKAEAEVERMRPFEEYYRMHFTMTHGKKLDVIA